MATWTQYSDAIRRHDGYANDPVTANGITATAQVAHWFAAVAKDLAASGTPTSAVGTDISPSTTDVAPSTPVAPPSTDVPSSGLDGLQPDAETTASTTGCVQ